MKTVAQKPQGPENRTVRGKSAQFHDVQGTYYPRPSPFWSVIQRTPLCPCDGGCPRCTSAVQAKLSVSQPQDRYEQEADRVADQVMRLPEPDIRRKPT